MKKIIVILLSIMMAFTLVGCGNKSEETEESETAEEETVAEQTTTTTTPMNVSSGEAEKKETVYALLDATGQSTEIIVSDELKNFSAGTVNDKSDLADIENVKGDETFTQNGTELTWNSTGNNIYYQGTSTKQLPITVKVTYTLDGSEISASDIVGKSGHVTIRYDFTNNTSETVDKKSYIAPFICLGGTILDNTHFRNIKLTNGEAIDDGEHTAVAGYALPGVINSLNLKEKYTEKIGDKSYFMIEADATDFTMSNVFLAVSNSLTNNVDSLDTSSLDDLTDDIDELADGMQKLRDGAYELAYGADELKYGLATLVSNNDTLNAGASKVFDSILETTTTQVNASLAAYGTSIPDLTQSNYSTVLNGLLKNLLGTSFVDAAKLGVLQARTQDIPAKVETALTSKKELDAGGTPNLIQIVVGNVEAQVKAQVQSQIKSTVLTNGGITSEQFNALEAAVNSGQAEQAQIDQYNALISAINTAIAANLDSNTKAVMDSKVDDIAGMIANAVITGEDSTDHSIYRETYDQYCQNVWGSLDEKYIMNANNGSADYNGSIVNYYIAQESTQKTIIDTLTAKIEKILKGEESSQSWDSTYDAIIANDSNIISAIDAGVVSNIMSSSVLDNIGNNDAKIQQLKKLKEALNSLASYSTFYSGLKQYTDGVYSAYKGSRELAEGASELEDGIKKFDDEGVSKLVDVVKNDLKVALDNLDNLKEASEQYDIYTDKADGVKSSVSFVYRIDAVESDAE